MNAERITLPNGLECYCLSQQETGYIYKEIFVENHYIQRGISLQAGDIVFDVGANIGLFTLFLTQLQQDVNVCAFEPIPETFKVLQNNISLHSLTKVSLFNYGLSSKNAVDQVFTFYPNMAGNSTAKPLEKSTHQAVMNAMLDSEKASYFFQSQVVHGELRTLSSVIRELQIPSIDLLKIIDVEGEEFEVLKGIEQQDWKKIKQIVMEVHDYEGRLGNVQQLLESNSFSLTIEKNSLVPPQLNNFNVYAVR